MSGKFGFSSTALEVVEGHNLDGYNVVVTGANSGIGVETVRALAKAGASVYMTARNTEKAQSVLDDIVKSTGNQNVYLEQLELDSLDNVNAFVSRFLARDIALHILINNAGIMACPLSYTKDGIESQFGVCHIGHFALTTGLLPCLKRGAKESGRNVRVVNLSSIAHIQSDFNFEDYNFKTRDYDAWVSYGQAKTSNALFSLGLNNRYSKDGVFSNSVMPGFIFTGLQQHQAELTEEEMSKRYGKTKTIEQGASTTVWAAVDKELDGKGGLYLENCSIATEEKSMQDIFQNKGGYLSHIMNSDNAEKLFVLSEKLIKKE